jgi:putative oxidoreductase
LPGFDRQSIIPEMDHRAALRAGPVMTYWPRCAMHIIKIGLSPLARLLMSSLFIWDGIVQLRNPGATAKYFASVYVPLPEIAVWISIAIHFIGGLAVLVGWKTRWAAALLALFCLGTAFGVHLPIGDNANMIHFYKNLAIAGGFLYVMNYGAGAMSIDGAHKV